MPRDADPVVPPDWPAPGAPLPSEEPTQELPLVRDDATPAWNRNTLGGAALSLALTRSQSTPPDPAGALSPGAGLPSSDAAPSTLPPDEGIGSFVPGFSDLPPEPEGPVGARSIAMPLHRPERPVPAPASETEQPGPAFAMEPSAPITDPSAPAMEWDTAAPRESVFLAEPTTPPGPTAPAATAADTPSEGVVSSGAPGPRWLVGAAVAAVALVLTGVTVLVVGQDSEAAETDQRWTPPVAAAGDHAATGAGAKEGDGASSDEAATGAGAEEDDDAGGHVATAARGGRTVAGFDLLDGARTVSVRTADLGDGLYRVATPAGGPAVPRVAERDGRVQLRFDGPAEAVQVMLSDRVRWDLRVAGGTDRGSIDLSAGRVAGVELSGGASRIDLVLPRPDGTLTVRMSGGVDLLDVRAAGAVPTRVTVARGAGQVVLDGETHSGVAAGRTFTSAAWADGPDRLEVDAAGGVNALTVASPAD
ncbi:hypothetical protein [Symbioplanes lichenis]|uniref:hypothetical protein n=1 Tax=Symbioplanes lichenis TaxID=1629072 RepID=UPI002739413B|nr:hypothetical protein [Actinoplanes lichenis]